MKVKILKSVASPTFSYAAGSTVDLTEQQATNFISAGVAEPLDIEKATAPTAKETTSTRKGRKKHADNSGDGKKAT